MFENFIRRSLAHAGLWIRFRLGWRTKVVKPLADSGTYERYGDLTREFHVKRELREWLDERCPGLWKARVNRVGSVEFSFARSGDATMFKLTW